MSLKLKALKATLRAANKLRYYANLKKKGPRIQAKSDIKYKFKQKPKTGGGPAPVTTTGTRYGVGSIEHKVHRPGIALASKRWGKHWPHERESWRSQMDRMYGGVHMSLDPKRIKKSVKLLTKQLKKKKIKKATEGGEVVIGKNVDRSLL